MKSLSLQLVVLFPGVIDRFINHLICRTQGIEVLLHHQMGTKDNRSAGLERVIPPLYEITNPYYSVMKDPAPL